jgi:hypothetical protein
MPIGTLLLIILILALVGIIPVWPHSRSWGYAPGRKVVGNDDLEAEGNGENRHGKVPEKIGQFEKVVGK